MAGTANVRSGLKTVVTSGLRAKAKSVMLAGSTPRLMERDQPLREVMRKLGAAPPDADPLKITGFSSGYDGESAR